MFETSTKQFIPTWWLAVSSATYAWGTDYWELVKKNVKIKGGVSTVDLGIL